MVWEMIMACLENISVFIITEEQLMQHLKALKTDIFMACKPTAATMPNFRNVYKQETGFMRLRMTHIYGGRETLILMIILNKWRTIQRCHDRSGTWNLFVMMQGETIEKTNHVRLSTDKRCMGNSFAGYFCCL